MLRTFILRNDQHAQSLWAFLKGNWKAMADQGKPLSVTIAEHKARRNNEQNALLHALLQEIAEQAWVEGKQYDMETWKEFFRCTYIGTEEITLPGGKRLERGISTTTLSVHDFADFVTKIQAYAIDQLGVEFQQ